MEYPTLEESVSPDMLRRFTPVRRAREKAGLSQRDAEQLLGFSRQRLDEYEHLRRVPTRKHMDKMSQVYNQPLEFLFPLCNLLEAVYNVQQKKQKAVQDTGNQN